MIHPHVMDVKVVLAHIMGSWDLVQDLYGHREKCPQITIKI